MSEVDEKYPLGDNERAERAIREFSEKMSPLAKVFSLLDGASDHLDIGGMFEEAFDVNVESLAENFVLIRRTTLYLSALYVFIGTGRL